MRHHLVRLIDTNRLRLLIPIVLLSAIVIGSMPLQVGAVSSYQTQIDALNRQIRQDRSVVRDLQDRRDTLNNRLSQLRAEQEEIRARIDKTELAITQTIRELQETEAEIERQRQILQENARIVYKRGQITTLEILFSSSSLAEFISEQEYLRRANEAVEEAARQSTILKSELEDKEAKLSQDKAQLRSQQNALDAKEREQNQLIAETRGEERRYQELVASNTAERERLEAQQRAALAAAAAAARSSGQFVNILGSGSYPWAQMPYPCWSAACADPWGLYYKECVSYTAWKVASTGRFVPHFAGQGHARQWPTTTAAYDIDQGSTPKEGSVAISYIGVFGHSMYVEEVLDGGANIRISEYNFLPGAYSERIIPSTGLVYIYF